MQDAAPGTQIWLFTHDPTARSAECGLAVFREQQHAHKIRVPTTLTGEVCKQENLHPQEAEGGACNSYGLQEEEYTHRSVSPEYLRSSYEVFRKL